MNLNKNYNKTMIYENIILGGGAAGLFCCANIEGASSKTLLIESNSKLGIKLLASGSGQCNLTHGGDIKDFLNKYGDKGKKIRKVLYRFNNLKVVDFFEERGVLLFERLDKKIFPKSLRSRDIIQCLEEEIRKKGIKVVLNSKIVNISTERGKIEGEDNLYVLENLRGEVFKCKNLIVAVGGKSYSKTGSDGKFLDVLERNLDIDIVKMRPSLVPVYIENYSFKNISGVSIEDVMLKLNYEGKKLTDKNDLLFTHKNFSGPLFINNSRYMLTGSKVELNFLNSFMEREGLDEDNLYKYFGENKNLDKSIGKNLSDIFSLPKSFVEEMIFSLMLKEGLDEDEARNFHTKKIKHIGKKDMRKIIENLLRYNFVVSGNEGFERAMATTGGVCLNSVNLATMEHKKHPNLYFIGECLDVDGDTGGYNIQFAFSSGYIAAQHISQ